jgi:hypothetical protein
MQGDAGPLAGTVPDALDCLLHLRSASYNSDLLLSSHSYAGIFHNLFLLIPLSPFDGRLGIDLRIPLRHACGFSACRAYS